MDSEGQPRMNQHGLFQGVTSKKIQKASKNVLNEIRMKIGTSKINWCY